VNSALEAAVRRLPGSAIVSDLWRLQADLLLARSELAVNLLGQRLLDSVAPRGDGHRPVILLPGFLVSGSSLGRLKRFLNANGYDAHGWGVGRNLGPRDQSMEAHLQQLEARIGDTVRRLADHHSAPVALIGQSLGGVYARELAMRLMPDIDRIIMLGSPAFHPYLRKRHNGLVGLLGYGVTRQTQSRFAGRWGLLHWHGEHPRELLAHRHGRQPVRFAGGGRSAGASKGPLGSVRPLPLFPSRSPASDCEDIPRWPLRPG
jgi:pimeloyl-ACP methyl ester carboxylesterase